MSTKSGAEWREKNQADWDERVPIHLHAVAYGVTEWIFAGHDLTVEYDDFTPLVWSAQRTGGIGCRRGDRRCRCCIRCGQSSVKRKKKSEKLL